MVNNSTKRAQKGNPTNQSPSHLHQAVEVSCPAESPHLSLPLSTHSNHSNIYSCEHTITFSHYRSFELADTGQSRLHGNIMMIMEEEVSSTIPPKSMEILSKVLKQKNFTVLPTTVTNSSAYDCILTMFAQVASLQHNKILMF